MTCASPAPAPCASPSEIGFLTSDKQGKLEALVGRCARGPYQETFVATFAELVPDGEEMVYDLNVPGLHSFVANGLVVHNCGEQSLPALGRLQPGPHQPLAASSKTARSFGTT